MKIIHTFFPTKYGQLSQSVLLNMSLSTLLVNKLGAEIVLYTTEEIKNTISQLNLPYSEINYSIKNTENDLTFSIPKLRVYSEQVEPFVHIDLDTFLFKFPLIEKRDYTYCAYFEGLNFISNFSGKSFYSSFDGFYKTYYEKSKQIVDNLDEKFVSEIRFDVIPNMCFVGGYQNLLIKEASKFCLDIYYDNKSFFDKEYYNACIIEQLFIPSAMRMIDSDTKFEPLFDGTPNSFFVTDYEKGYPFSMRNIHEIVTFQDQTELLERIDFDFNGFLHLNGYKTFDPVLFWMKEKIKKFGNGEKILDTILKLYP